MPDYDDYQHLLSDLDATVECAEAHGILCGMLSLDPGSQRSDWLGLDDKVNAEGRHECRKPEGVSVEGAPVSSTGQALGYKVNAEGRHECKKPEGVSVKGAPRVKHEAGSTLSRERALSHESPNELFTHFLTKNQTAQHTDSTHAAAIAELATLHRQTRTQLSDMNYDFSPLLPADSESIAARTQALSLWCQGFLFGLSVSGLKTLDALSEASREIVEDFSAIAQLAEQFEEGEDEESA
ncbi:MAG: UPF0149 family protein, partial [Gammaproteobacteria bacterium]|nr:UPF0149 family protein [Gammaproteobacteria bacterium]